MTKPTNTERITALEAEVVTLKLQVRALLQSQTLAAENNASVAEAVTDLTSMVRKILVRESVQLVFDYMDGQEPTLADVMEIDEYYMGETLWMVER